MTGAAVGRQPPARPPARQEAWAQRLFLALAPRLRAEATAAPPARFAPFELVRVPPRRGCAELAATWFPAPGRDRGCVVLLPPWLASGRAYFHRRGRIQALRAAGYDVLTIDLPAGGHRTGRFFDLAVEDAIAYLAAVGGQPLHLWGVSSGGYWAHPALARSEAVKGAFFEDVSPHLLEWSRRVIPWGRPCYAFFRHTLPVAYRFLDMRAHAAAFRLPAVTYVAGGCDRGIPADDTLALARAAGAACRIVPGAPHLGAIKVARRTLIDLALATFEQAVAPAPGLLRPAGAAATRRSQASPPAVATSQAST